MQIFSKQELEERYRKTPDSFKSDIFYTVTPYNTTSIDAPVYVLLNAEEYLRGTTFDDIVSFVEDVMLERQEEAPITPIPCTKKKETLTGILKERQATHGNFADIAVFSQTLKAICREQQYWPHLSYEQKESVDNIIQKLARIFAGNADFSDH